MGERVLLVNPIKRKRAAKKPAKKRAVGYTVGNAPVRRRKLNPIKRGPKMAKRRTAAQRRATAKLVAFNRSRRRLSNPARKRRRLRRNPVSKAAAYRAVPTIARANPVRRRRRRLGSSTSVRRVRRRVRRNPLPSMGGVMSSIVTPAVFAAAGALALDIGFGYLPIPANLKTGPLNLVTKAAGAVVLSMLAGKVVGKSKGQLMGVGALTVVMHDAAKAFIAGAMPTLKMDGLGYYSAGYPVGGYESQGMGVYLGAGGARSSGLPNMNGMGEYVNGMGRVDNEAQYYGG
jgi:hypothetical protein